MRDLTREKSIVKLLLVGLLGYLILFLWGLGRTSVIKIPNGRYDMPVTFMKEKDDQAQTKEEAAKSLVAKLPYEGMEEKYLSSTSMGTAYYYGANTVYLENGNRKTADIYYYYDGSAIVFTARIVDGKVYDISDFRNDPWNRPQIFKAHPYENNSVKGGKICEEIIISGNNSYADPYDTDFYDDADEFADDWEDEFDDLDDAWDFYNEYMEDYLL